MSESTDISSPEIEEQLFDPIADSPTFCEVTDDCLRDSLLSCCTQETITPLVKQTLKMEIQNRRLSEGKQELKVSFSPPPIYKLTPDEERRQEIRKQRNRKSANISRIKRKQHEENLKETLQELEKEQEQLKKTVETYKKMERTFRTTLYNHVLRCPIYKEKVRILKQRLAGRLHQNVTRPMEGGAT